MIDELRTRTGPLAFGLACGAHPAVGDDRWAVRGATEWQRTMDGLLAERGVRPNDLAMDLRWRATVVRTVPPDAAGWQRIIRQAAEYGQIGSRGVPILLAAAERISRYEDRFRADGLISPRGVVHSLRAHDWGRAVNLARAGLRGGHCDKAAARRAVLRAGELCARHYMSWADLSAAFGLGRMLSVADEDFAVHYATVRDAHRRLLDDDASPWRTVAWPHPAFGQS